LGRFFAQRQAANANFRSPSHRREPLSLPRVEQDSMGDVQIPGTRCVEEVAEASPAPEQLLGAAIGAFGADAAGFAAALEALPAPIYLTDADGWVTHFNSACIAFAGRVPVPGEDRWCVTWRLYEENGDFLPHESCPMAVAIREQRPIRGIVAVAERPDGTRVMFTPFPTPIFDAAGRLVGAVNLLVDVTDRRQAESLRAQARRCRRLAQSVMDQRTVDTLIQMAGEYELHAERLDRR
jgi:PAS domain-containing protein